MHTCVRVCNLPGGDVGLDGHCSHVLGQIDNRPAGHSVWPWVCDCAQTCSQVIPDVTSVMSQIEVSLSQQSSQPNVSFLEG